MQADISKAVGTKDVPAEVTTAVRNNGGGHWNHSFFWTVLAKPDTKEADYQAAASDELKKAIEGQWGSLNAFQAKFNEAATAVFGSGCESHECYTAIPLFGGEWDAFGLSKASLLNHGIAETPHGIDFSFLFICFS